MSLSLASRVQKQRAHKTRTSPGKEKAPDRSREVELLSYEETFHRVPTVCQSILPDETEAQTNQG